MPNYNTNRKTTNYAYLQRLGTLRSIPDGWKIDKTTGSPLFGYDFCTDGKSIINGGKRALVKTKTKKIC